MTSADAQGNMAPISFSVQEKQQKTIDAPLKRVAAKITVYVRVADQVEIDNTIIIGGETDTRHEIWRPRLDENMQIYLVNGALNGQISGEPLTTVERFKYNGRSFDYTKGETYEYYTYTNTGTPENPVSAAAHP